MGNRIARWEIAAEDDDRLKAFYSELFGWTVDGNVVHCGDGIDGYLFKPEGGIPLFVTFYVEVEDFQAHLDRAAVLGGQVFVPPTPSPIPGEDSFAVFGDPAGNIVGLSRPGR